MGENRFYMNRHGERVWVNKDGVVRVKRSSTTNNPHAPAARWLQLTRTKNPDQYAQRKLATGEWKTV